MYLNLELRLQTLTLKRTKIYFLSVSSVNILKEIKWNVKTT